MSETKITRESDATPTAGITDHVVVAGRPLPDFDRRVGQYVALRDKINQIADAQKAQLAPYKNALTQLNGLLLAHLTAVDAESVRTGSGTVYRTTVDSATVFDAKVFRDYVVSSAEWGLLDVRANKVAVNGHVQSEGTPPPGVKFTRAYVVGVRRPTNGHTADDV